MTSAIKRIVNKDLKEIQNMDLKEQGIYIMFDEENMLNAYAIIIGPKDTPFEDGILYFTIHFPKNYPFSPPKINYLSHSKYRIHPNLYVGHSSEDFKGKVCLSIINTWSGPKWSTVMHIGSIMISIKSLLDDNPLRNEPGFENVNDNRNKYYNQIIQYDTFNHLILNNCFKIHPKFEIFSDIIQKHIQQNKDSILHKIQYLKKKYPCKRKITASVYRLNNILIDYSELYQRIKNKFDSI